MSNNYKSPSSEIVGREGQMYNEATITDQNIDFQDFSIFANDFTYPITFNPYLNRPKTKYIEHKPVRNSLYNQHITKQLHEPPVSMTDGMFYLHNDAAKPPPILPPYLNHPEQLGKVQGLANEQNKANIIGGPTHINIISNIVY